ncbi:MAG: hypothetical protein EOM74_02700 [Methanomicrobia archaeon]|nr:hypothetical protein [Methanomicrobia archaeon]
MQDSDKKLDAYDKTLDKIVNSAYGITYKSTMQDWMLSHCKDIIKDNIKEAKALDDDIIDKLASRYIIHAGYYSVSMMKKDMDKEIADAIRTYEKDNDIKKMTVEPLMQLFMNLGQDLIDSMTKFIALNPTEASKEMERTLQDDIRKIKASGNEANIKKLQKNIEEVTDPKRLEHIVPTEGIVFMYKGKLYKFTGYFHIINQIMGILKYN